MMMMMMIITQRTTGTRTRIKTTIAHAKEFQGTWLPICLTLFRLGGGGGAFDATEGFNHLLLTNDCAYSIPAS